MTETVATALGVRTGGRHSVVPARAYADIRLKPIDVCILGLIAITESADQIRRRDGWFQLSQGAMAVLGGMSRTTINRSLQALEEVGYIITQEEKTEAGGTAPKLYSIVFDGCLEKENDRWLGAGQSKKRKPTPVHETHTPCSPDAQGSQNNQKTAETLGVHILNRGGVQNLNRGVQDLNTTETLEPGDVLESTLLNSLEFESSDPAHCVTQAFIDSRKEHYPDKLKGMCCEAKLKEQARLYLDMGLHPDRMIEVLREQIRITAQRGIDAPAGITRFKNDLKKAVRESVSDYLPPSRKSATSSRTAYQSTPKEAQPLSEMAILMGRIGELVREREIKDVIPWLNAIRCHAVSSDGICLRATSDTLVDVLEQNADALVACVHSATGNTSLQLEIRKG